KEGDINNINESAETAIREDFHFYGVSESLGPKLNLALNQFNQVMSELQKVLKKMMDGSSGKVDSKALNLLFDQAFRNTGLLWNVSAKELEVLLDKRIESQISDRTQALILTLGAWVIALLTVLYVGRLSLKKQHNLLSKIYEQSAAMTSSSRLTALGEMAGNIAHEINTPIATIH
ncbi:MAG: hypothetical protein AABZ55_10140, partial [Bdellovibrionota bacterium]